MATVQLDDQSPGSSFPVVLWHAAGPNADALMHASVVETAANERDGKSYPYMALELTQDPIQLRVHEPLIWRLRTFAQARAGSLW